MTVSDIQKYRRILNEDDHAADTEHSQILLVKSDPSAITTIDNPSEAVQIAAVSRFSPVIQFINNPSEAVQLAAVNTGDARAIRGIKNPSEDIQLAAVRANAQAIEHIRNPSEAVKLAVAKSNPWLLNYIPQPSKNVVLTALLKMIKEQDPDLNLFANAKKNNPEWPEWPVIEKALRDIGALGPTGLLDRLFESDDIIPLSSLSQEEQIDAVTKAPSRIRYMHNPSEAVQLAAVKSNGLMLQYIKNPSEAVQLAAVSESPTAIRYISKPSEQVKILAVSKYAAAIHFIDNPSEAVQLATVKKDWRFIHSIDTESKSVILAAILSMVKSNDFSVELYSTYRDKFPEWPEWNIIDKILQKDKRLNEAKHLNLTDEKEKIEAVKKNGFDIARIKNPSEAVQLAAINQDWRAIRYIKNLTELGQLAAIKQSHYAVRWIENPVRSDDPTVKRNIITFFLRAVTGNEFGFDYTSLYNKYKAIYPDWHEWSVIDKLINSTKHS